MTDVNEDLGQAVAFNAHRKATLNGLAPCKSDSDGTPCSWCAIEYADNKAPDYSQPSFHVGSPRELANWRETNAVEQ